ncbi:MAG: hypothetical protein KDJ97_30755 [Anaerolineae bacterium]|nr:hypothetical protein [Anaerolineae bacterium]
MNKSELLQLNVIPEGKAAWLSYEQYLELKRLFEAVPLPSAEETTDNLAYLALHRFLSEIAGLQLAPDEAAIHFNAFALIRRGYKIEAITLEEYKQLRRLMAGLEQPDIDDVDLYETGGHHALYDYLTRGMGLTVQPGRGPAWHRAKVLIEKYEG